MYNNSFLVEPSDAIKDYKIILIIVQFKILRFISVAFLR